MLPQVSGSGTFNSYANVDSGAVKVDKPIENATNEVSSKIFKMIKAFALGFCVGGAYGLLVGLTSILTLLGISVVTHVSAPILLVIFPIAGAILGGTAAAVEAWKN